MEITWRYGLYLVLHVVYVCSEHKTETQRKCPRLTMWVLQRKLRCTFDITAKEGERVQAVVLVFDGKRGLLCRYDRVNIFDGIAPYSQPLNEACAVRTNFTTTSSGRYMRVELTMMFTLHDRGFKMMYTSGIFAVSKHADLTAGSYIQSIRSPGYPGLYEGKYHLSWRIYSGSLTDVIRMAVEKSDLPCNPNCSSDYLEAYDGYDSSNTSVAKWCGDERPSLDSSGPHMFIEFRASGATDHGFFLIKYSIKVELKPPNPQEEFENSFIKTTTTLGISSVVVLVLFISICAWKRRHRPSNTTSAVMTTTMASDPEASDVIGNHEVMMSSKRTGGETQLPPPYAACCDKVPPPSYDSLQFGSNSGKC